MASTTAQKSARHLVAISDTDMAAWNTLTPATTAALFKAVTAATAADHTDVREAATMVAASHWQSVTTAATDADRVTMAARSARRTARRWHRGAMAWEQETTAGISAETWELFTGDGTQTTVSHSDTAPADGIARTTPADVVAVALAGVESRALATAVADYRAHNGAMAGVDADTTVMVGGIAYSATMAGPGCSCHTNDPGTAVTGATIKGRRPSLIGMTAHLAGVTDTMPAYSRLTKPVRAAVKAVDREHALTYLGGAPMAGRPVASSASMAGATPATTEHPTRPILGRAATLPGVTVERPGRAARTVTREEALREASASAAWERASDRAVLAADALRAASLFSDAGAWLTADATARAARIALIRATVAMRAAERPAVRTARPGRTVALPALPVGRPTLAPVTPGMVTVTTRDGATVTRDTTDAEAATATAPNAGRVAVTALPDGFAVGEAHGGHKWDMRAAREDGRIGSHKPVVSPRKKAGGQTGPTVTGAPATLGMTGESTKREKRTRPVAIRVAREAREAADRAAVRVTFPSWAAMREA